MTTFAGTLALPELQLSWIVKPPAGAGPLTVTVAVEVFPPETLVGLSTSETKTVGLMSRLVFTEFPLKVPVSVAFA